MFDKDYATSRGMSS